MNYKLIKSFITFHKEKIYMQRGKVNRIFRGAIKKSTKRNQLK